MKEFNVIFAFFFLSARPPPKEAGGRKIRQGNVVRTLFSCVLFFFQTNTRLGAERSAERWQYDDRSVLRLFTQVVDNAAASHGAMDGEALRGRFRLPKSSKLAFLSCLW